MAEFKVGIGSPLENRIRERETRAAQREFQAGSAQEGSGRRAVVLRIEPQGIIDRALRVSTQDELSARVTWRS